MSDFWVEAETRTWRSENAGLFDFETRDVTRRTLRLSVLWNGGVTLVRHSPEGEGVETVEAFNSAGDIAGPSEHTAVPLLHLSRTADGALRVRSSTRHLWRRVTNEAVRLESGDWVRLGRMRLKFRELAKGEPFGRWGEEGGKMRWGGALGMANSSSAGAVFSADSACRICYGGESGDLPEGDLPEGEGIEGTLPLVGGVCGCRGSMANVHAECLQRWIGGKHFFSNRGETGESGMPSETTTCMIVREVKCELCRTRISELGVTRTGKTVALLPLIAGITGKSERSVVFETKTGAIKYVLVFDGNSAKKLKIGRAPQTDMPFTDISVSRLHAFLHVGEDGKFSISDNGSRFGTLISDAKADLVVKPGNPDVTIQAGRTLVKLTVRPVKRPLAGGNGGRLAALFRCCSRTTTVDDPETPPHRDGPDREHDALPL